MKLRKLYDVLSLTTLFGVYIGFIITFAVAYFDPASEVTIYINSFNEKHFEALLFIVMVPGVVTCGVKLLNDLRERYE